MCRSWRYLASRGIGTAPRLRAHRQRGAQVVTTLQDRVALVTGSSRGIGAAIATLFANEGARVVVHGRDADAVETVRNQIATAGGQAMCCTADLTHYQEIEEVRERIEQVHGPVDILVANAGGSTSRPSPFEEISEEAWRTALDSNLTATFLTIKCFLPGMKERGRRAPRRRPASAPRPRRACRGGRRARAPSAQRGRSAFHERLHSRDHRR
jgi:NAD(P)-dependent dehydrogenase (short-subunit alcohol dehydrogenase family)